MASLGSEMGGGGDDLPRKRPHRLVWLLWRGWRRASLPTLTIYLSYIYYTRSERERGYPALTPRATSVMYDVCSKSYTLFRQFGLPFLNSKMIFIIFL